MITTFRNVGQSKKVRQEDIMISKNPILTIALVIFVMVTALGWFYWFQYRPAKIKHDCSWVKKHANAVEYKPATAIKKISATDFASDLHSNSASEQVEEGITSDRLDEILSTEYSPEISASPAKDWWEEATPQEYNFCLHNNGL